jgi:hypothetical protein
LATASTVTLGSQAQEAGIRTINIGAAGAYTITATDMTVDLTIDATDAGENIVVIKSGQGDDTIILDDDTGADIVHLQAFATNGLDTITEFDTTEDDLNLDVVMTGRTDVVAVVALAAGVCETDFVDNEVYVFADGATVNDNTNDPPGTDVITSYTNLTQVAAFVSDNLTLGTNTVSNDTVAGDEAIFVINDLVANLTYVYHFKESGTGIDASAGDVVSAAELTLIAVVTESAGVALVAADIV